MNLRKTTSYSLGLLSFMAENPGKIVSAGLIHKKLDIPYQYLRQLLTTLSKSGFIMGSKGRNGGYTFTRSTDEIFLAEIVHSIEGQEILNRCVLGYKACPFDNYCPVHDIWQSARDNIIKVLQTTPLSEITNKNL